MTTVIASQQPVPCRTSNGARGLAVKTRPESLPSCPHSAPASGSGIALDVRSGKSASPSGSGKGCVGIARSWNHLIARPSSWRKQLSLKQRNITVGQLVRTIRANKLSPRQASEDMDLPLEAIEEALAYFDENRSLIEQESEAERHWLAERGYGLEPHNLPR